MCLPQLGSRTQPRLVEYMISINFLLRQVKPLVDVVKCPDWVRPAVQQVFGKARTREMMGDVLNSFRNVSHS